MSYLWSDSTTFFEMEKWYRRLSPYVDAPPSADLQVSAPLQVKGAAEFLGGLDVGGDLRVGGTLAVDSLTVDNVPMTPGFPACYRAASLAGGSSEVVVDLDLGSFVFNQAVVAFTVLDAGAQVAMEALLDSGGVPAYGARLLSSLVAGSSAPVVHEGDATVPPVLVPGPLAAAPAAVVVRLDAFALGEGDAALTWQATSTDAAGAARLTAGSCTVAAPATPSRVRGLRLSGARFGSGYLRVMVYGPAPAGGSIYAPVRAVPATPAPLLAGLPKGAFSTTGPLSTAADGVLDRNPVTCAGWATDTLTDFRIRTYRSYAADYSVAWDLGAEYALTEFRIQGCRYGTTEVCYVASFRLQTSADGAAWSTVPGFDAAPSRLSFGSVGEVAAHALPAGTRGRFVRMVALTIPSNSVRFGGRFEVVGYVPAADDAAAGGPTAAFELTGARHIANETTPEASYGAGTLAAPLVARALRLDCRAREQGWGALDSSVWYGVRRGRTVLASVGFGLARTESMVPYSHSAALDPTVVLRAGDEAFVALRAPWPGQEAFLEDARVTVFGA